MKRRSKFERKQQARRVVCRRSPKSIFIVFFPYDLKRRWSISLRREGKIYLCVADHGISIGLGNFQLEKVPR